MSFEDPNLAGLFKRSVAVGARLPTEQECRRVWQLNRKLLIAAALDAERWAVSYSGKHYASACLAFRCEAAPEDRFRIFGGWNCTPFRRPKGHLYDTTWPKPCAERMAAEMAREAGYEPYGYATLSDNDQRDDISGRWCIVQHPCFECRCMFDQQRLPLSAPLMLMRRWSCASNSLLIVDTTFGESCRVHMHTLSDHHLF